MNYAIIENGIVVNLIVAGEDFELDGVTLVQSDTARIGDLYEDGVFTTPPAEEPPTPTYPTQTILQSPNGTPVVITVTDDGKVEAVPLSEVE